MQIFCTVTTSAINSTIITCHRRCHQCLHPPVATQPFRSLHTLFSNNPCQNPPDRIIHHLNHIPFPITLPLPLFSLSTLYTAKLWLFHSFSLAINASPFCFCFSDRTSHQNTSPTNDPPSYRLLYIALRLHPPLREFFQTSSRIISACHFCLAFLHFATPPITQTLSIFISSNLFPLYTPQQSGHQTFSPLHPTVCKNIERSCSFPILHNTI